MSDNFIIRPTLLGAGTFRDLTLTGVRNHIRDDMPTTVEKINTSGVVDTSWSKDYISPIEEAYLAKFHFPVTGPLLICESVFDAVAIGNNDNAGTYDIEVRFYAMTQSWNVDTVTWNTKPTPTIDDQYISFRIHKTASSFAPISRSQRIVFEVTLPVLGFMTQLIVTSITSAQFVTSTSNINHEITDRSKRTLNVVNRETVGGFGILTTSSPHGLTTDNKNMVIMVTGVAAAYNITAVINDIPSATTIKYFTGGAPEASTPCGGTISYW